MTWFTTICYFGTRINKNNIIKKVTKHNWNLFVNNNISDKFKSFTISSNYGFWNNEKELTYTLTIIHQNDKNIMDNLIKLAKEYKVLFNQDEIIINTTTSVSFIEIKD